MNHYEVLGVPKDADSDTIKAAYRAKASANHPDREGGSAEVMAAVNRAYEILGDAERRARYDATGQETEPLTIEEKAEAKLLDIFRGILDSEQAISQFGVVGSARQIMEKTLSDMASHRAKLEATRKRLAKLSGKVQVEGRPRNLVQMLLDQRIRDLGATLAKHDEEIKLAECIRDILNAYRDDEDIFEKIAPIAPQWKAVFTTTL